MLVNVAGGMVTVDEQTKYVFNRLVQPSLFGRWSGESEIARLDADGSIETLANITGSRVPVLHMLFAPNLSPSGDWLAFPLIDGATTNIWAVPTRGGALRPLTDFGTRTTLIARSVAWAHDSQSIYGAVADIETDVVLFDGLID